MKFINFIKAWEEPISHLISLVWYLICHPMNSKNLSKASLAWWAFCRYDDQRHCDTRKLLTIRHAGKVPSERNGYFSIEIQILSAWRKWAWPRRARYVGLFGDILSPRVKQVTKWLSVLDTIRTQLCPRNNRATEVVRTVNKKSSVLAETAFRRAAWYNNFGGHLFQGDTAGILR